MKRLEKNHKFKAQYKQKTQNREELNQKLQKGGSHKIYALRNLERKYFFAFKNNF